jgi:bifunctional DNase/RNase
MTTRRQVLRLLAVGGTASLVVACNKPLLATFPTPAVAAAPPPALAERSIDLGEAAAVTADGYSEVAVESVRVNETTQQYVMLLQEPGTQRFLPITTGRFGADAIAIRMQQIPVSRPLSHGLMLDLVTATGSRVREVRIDRVAQSEEGDTFYSTIVLATPAGSRAVDARPGMFSRPLESPMRLNRLRRHLRTRATMSMTRYSIGKAALTH